MAVEAAGGVAVFSQWFGAQGHFLTTASIVCVDSDVLCF